MGKGKGIDFGGICKVRVSENIDLLGKGKVRVSEICYHFLHCAAC